MLPIGFEHDDHWVRTYQLRELMTSDVKLIRDRSLMRKSQMEWLGRVICLGLEELAGVPVYDYYAESKYKALPSIVSKLSIADITYLVVAIHVNSFGHEASNVEIKCPECKKVFSADFDLNDMVVTRSDEPIREIEVLFEGGFKLPPKLAEAHGLSERFTKYVVRPATLGDAIAAGPYTPNSPDFAEKVTVRTVLAAYDEKGIKMPDEVLSQVRSLLVDQLPARDSRKLRNAVNHLPSIDRKISLTCPLCEETFGYEADTSFLFLFT